MFHRPGLFVYFSLLLMAATACQSVSDLQPKPDALPASVVEVLETEFPGYTDITVSPLEKDRVWSARLRMDTSRFDVVLNRTKILSRFRLGNTVPPGLAEKINSTRLSGGTFTEYKERQRKKGEFPDREYSARYVWNSTEFYATWTSMIPSSGRLDLYPDVETSYLTDRMDDLPEAIQRTIQRKIKEAQTDPKTPRQLDFWNARVYHYRTKKKSYEISFGVTHLEIGPDGAVIFWDFSEGFDNGFDVLLTQEEIPQEIVAQLDSDPIARTLPRFLAVRFTESGTTRYRIVKSDARLGYSLYFDEKNTLVRRYFLYYF